LDRVAVCAVSTLGATLQGGHIVDGAFDAGCCGRGGQVWLEGTWLLPQISMNLECLNADVRL